MKATIIADSIHNGKRITTMELEYPRYIHSQILTHRVFSRNSASSRAIPVAKMIDLVETNPVIPSHWGKNQSGMQAYETVDASTANNALNVWLEAKRNAVESAKQLMQLGIHKQVVNRLLEPFQMIKVILTATEWDNFFNLRLAHDSQPEIQELANLMKEAMDNSKPRELSNDEWHLPYAQDKDLDLDTAIKLSVSCCAQVSYRALDDDLDKANRLHDWLVSNGHYSCVEHQAKPATNPTDRSNNFIGWIQYRETLNG